MERKKRTLAAQIRRSTRPAEKKEYDGDFGTVISTGSTLLDLVISGGRIRGGGLPLGILVEIFGASGCGKTVLLSEIAGAMQRNKADITFHDPEARLNKQFARIFGLNTDELAYNQPDTVTELFQQVRSLAFQKDKLYGVFADSLAALSTDLEMESKDGDKMGMRRAKEFSEELRRTARIIVKNQILMVCSNQVRTNTDAGQWGQKYKTPGGEAVAFYSSLRLRAKSTDKIYNKIHIAGKEEKRVIGVRSTFEVHKSSIWKPHRAAPVSIIFDYGVDDIRENLQFIKTYTKATMYMLGDTKLSQSLEEAVQRVEQDTDHVDALKEEVIDLWERIEKKFETNRKPKQR